MEDMNKTKEQLIDELVELRQRFARLEASEDEREQAEEQLKILSLAVEHDTNSIAILDKEGIVKYVNPKLLQVYSANPEEIIGKYWGAFVSKHSSLREKYQEIRNTVIEKGMIWRGEVTDRAKNGEIVWRAATILPIKDSKGEMIYSIYTSEDITKRKQVEEALRESEEKYRILVENANEAILVAQDGMLKFVNPKAVELTGYSEDELTARPFMEFIHPDDQEMVVERYMERLKGEEVPQIYEFRLIDKHGNVRWSEINAALIAWEEKPATLNLLTDITERKRAENLISTQRDLGLALSSATGLNEGLRLCLEVALRVSEMDSGGIYLVDKTSDALNLVFHKGLPPDFVKSASRYDADSDSACLVMAGKPVYSRHQDLGVTIDQVRKREQLRAIAVVPICYEDRVIGCLNVASHRFDEVPPFARDSLEIIAAQIGSVFTRLEAEEALRESEEKFAKAFSSSPNLMAITRMADGCIVDVNKCFVQTLGYSREELIGRSTLDVGLWVQPEDRDKLIKTLQVDGKSYDNFEFQARAKSGEIRSMLMAGEIVNLGNGDPHLITISSDITERRRAEEKYQALYEAASDAIFMVQLTNEGVRFVECNPRVLDMFGCKREEIIGKSPVDFSPLEQPDGRPSAERVAEVAAATMAGVPQIFEWAHRRLDGTSFDAEISLSRVDIGSDTYLLAMVRDITERRQSEEALRESEERFRSIVQSSPMGMHMYQLEPDGQLVFTGANPAADEILGVKNTQFIGKTIEEAFPPLAETEVPERYRMAASEGEGWSTEQIDYEDKRIKGAFEVRAFQTAPDKMVAMFLDVTERKQAEEASRNAAQVWQDTFDAIIDGIAISDTNGVITQLNGTFAKLYGYSSPKELIGRTFFELIAESDLPKAMEIYKEFTENGRSVHQNLELIQRRKDGGEFPALISISILYDENGEVLGSIAVVRDITERKRLEEELLKVQKLESVGILAGGIAHDLNNLLTGVMGNISLARLYEDPVKKDIRLDEAEKASMQIKDLTQQLLTFSKGGAPILKTAAIGELLRNSATFMLRGANVGCEFSIPDDLWPVEADKGQMNQVINNLVINAQQAMPMGGAVRVSAENIAIGAEFCLPLEPGAYIKISIGDQGVGIPEDYLQRIFDPFFSTKQAGSGLGLATSYSIVQKHNGHITVESQVGVGTTFHIYLPASPEGVLIEERKEEKKPIMGEGRILVMDDEEHVRDVAFDMLDNIGYEATTAVDGAEAVEMYRQAMESGNPFDAVIVDLTVPGGMGGEEAIQKLIEIDPEAKAIVSSGYSINPILANFAEYGFKGVIAKPYKTRELSEVLHKVITGADDA